jgi:hypothetical protein
MGGAIFGPLTLGYYLQPLRVLVEQRNPTSQLTGRGDFIQPSYHRIKLRNRPSARRPNDFN